MNYSCPKNVVVSIARLSTTKLASIYFDYVVPIFVDDFPAELLPPGFEDWTPNSPLDVLKAAQDWAGSKNVAVPLSDGRKVRLTDDRGNPDIESLELVNEYSFLNNAVIQDKLYSEMYNAAIEKAPIISSGESIKPIEQMNSLSDITITLANMPLIDVDNSPWEQIIELRKDVEARNKLSLYLTSKYIGQPLEQVEAGIYVDIDNYVTEAKKHGFSLGSGVLQATADSRTLLGSIGGGAFLGSLIGADTTAIGAVAGLSVEISRISISVAKGLYDVRQLTQHHPLSYVFKVQKALGN